MLRHEQFWLVCFLENRTKIDGLLPYIQCGLYCILVMYSLDQNQKEFNKTIPHIFNCKGALGFFSPAEAIHAENCSYLLLD